GHPVDPPKPHHRSRTRRAPHRARRGKAGLGIAMNVIRLGCGRAGTLFYEPDGLLLRSCLIPVDKRHSEHLLTFQLGYIGPGEITVHVALDGGPHDGYDLNAEPSITAALLRGTESPDDLEECAHPHHRSPGVWLTYVSVPDTKVSYRYT